MAIENTRIYKDSMDMNSIMMRAVNNMNKSLKYILGEKIINESIEFLKFLYMAYATVVKEEKVKLLEESLKTLFIAETYLKISTNQNAISHSEYAQIIAKSKDVEKQITSWIQKLTDQIKTV